jgi:cytosine/adenosine deaminase-related metal-dependent hydrolase
MDLIVRNARLIDRLDDGLLDIAVEAGRIAAIGRALAADGESYDAAGRLVCAGLIESHIHLDKSRIADRCQTAGRSTRSRWSPQRAASNQRLAALGPLACKIAGRKYETLTIHREWRHAGLNWGIFGDKPK